MTIRTEEKYRQLADHFRSQLLPYERRVINLAFNNDLIDVSSDYNTEYCSGYATRNGLAAILYSSHKNAFNAELQAQLQKGYFANLILSARIEKTVEWLKTTLDMHGIQYLFLKGSLLAFTTYEDASLRPMSDIDILIEPRKSVEAYKILLENGAQSHDKTPVLAKNDHHLPGITHNEIIIEVHRSLFPVDAKYNMDVKQLFQRKRIWQKSTTQLPGPSVAQLAFYIATHAYYTYKRGGLRLSWFYDLKTLIPFLEKEDSEHLMNVAIENRLQIPVTFIGTIFYYLSNNHLPNWPLLDHTSFTRQEVNRIARSFRAGKDQNTSESYQLIIEQIHQAKGLKNKWQVIQSRLSGRGQLHGLMLIKHLAIVSYRLFLYLTNQLLKILHLK